jgi:Cupredoxin-like domain
MVLNRIPLSITIAGVSIVVAAFVIFGILLYIHNQNVTTATQKTFYINTVHLDGITSTNGTKDHPPEPFPTVILPPGGGYVLKKLDDAGNWKVRTFVFDPSQIVVHEGDNITLNILDVQGDHHAITVEGHGGEFILHRGELKTMTFNADKAGIIHYFCSIHQPTMQGEILVLPKA